MLVFGMTLAVAAALARIRAFVEVILHIGAHRTGTTTLQRLLEKNAHNLRKNGVTAWTPRTTRSGMFDAMLKPPAEWTPEVRARIRRDMGRISVELARLKQAGQRVLIVSEENMIGNCRANCARTRLYPLISERLQVFRAVFGQHTTRVCFGIRRYDDWWASALSYGIPVGFDYPDEAALDRMVTQPRTWTKIIREVARVFRGARLVVWDFDDVIGLPDAQFAGLTGGRFRGAFRVREGHHHRSPDPGALAQVLADRGHAVELPTARGRFMPFGPNHRAAMAQAFAEDRAWLMAGAEGFASFVGRPPGADAAWDMWKRKKTG